MAEEMEFADEQIIDFKCPFCGEDVSFPGMDAGKAQDCPFCMQVFMVPRESCEMGRKFPLPITTPRLLLRRLRLDDVDALTPLVSDEELLRYHALPAQNEEDLPEWIEADSKVDLSRLIPELFLAIELRGREKFIGLVSIKYGSEYFNAPEITVVVVRSEQRKGYGTEALRGLLEFGFRELNMRRIAAVCDTRNAAFLGLAAKVGLRQEGTFFEDRCFKGEWVSTAFFAELQSEHLGADSQTA